MDWRLAIEEDRAALKRIVALLLALADLAELVADRSPVVRALVLWLLRHGEAAAWNLIVGAPETSLPHRQLVPAGGSSSDAMQIAARLRALAGQIDLQARLACIVVLAQDGESDPLP